MNIVIIELNRQCGNVPCKKLILKMTTLQADGSLLKWIKDFRGSRRKNVLVDSKCLF